MNKDEFKDKADKFLKSLWALTDKYEEHNPEWLQTTLFQILYQAVENFKRVLEDPEEKDVTWDAPLTELRYPVEADWDKVEPVYFHLSPMDLEDPEKVPAKFTRSFIAVKELYVLRHVTWEILVIYKGGKGYYKVPLAVDKRLAKLKKAERARRLERILKPITKVTRFPLYEVPHGKKTLKAFLVFQFNPCVLNVDEKVAYYPIVIGLEFRGHTAKDLDEEARASLLTEYLKAIQELIPKEDWGFIKAPRPEPEARPVTKPEALVKVGLTLEQQKFGHRPRQLGLFDGLMDTTRKEIAEKSIEVIGLDISEAQRAALFAIQKLFSATDYKGNIPGKENYKSEAFSFQGFLPALQFTPAEYLAAYGLKKRKTARGWEEYSGEERRQALQALVDLTKPFLFKAKWAYPRTVRGKTETVINRIEKISPLILITRGWEALTKQEDAALDKGAGTAGTDEKLKAIQIEPSPIVVQGIERFYALKPANYAEEIKFLVPHASKFVYRFVDWLIVQAELKRRNRAPLVILENIQEIAYHLRMDAYIKTNQGKRIRQIIAKCYKVAKDLGYLLSYETVKGQTKDLERLELNPEKFRRVREIAEERERLEEENPAR